MRRVITFLLVILLLAGSALESWPALVGHAQGSDFPAYLPILFRPAQMLAVTQDLPVDAGSYLGGDGTDQAQAVALAADGSVWVGGMFPGLNPAGVTTKTLFGGGDAALVHLAADGQTVTGMTRLGSRLNDLEINASGQILVCGSFGVAQLTPAADDVVWQANPGEGVRCAQGADGSAAVKVSSQVYTYAADGAPKASWEVGGSTSSAHSDVALDSSLGLVFVTGYRQEDGGVCSQLQIAYLRAYSLTGELRWKAFDWNKTQVGAVNLCADTRGNRLALGEDGYLYFAGETAGGNTIYGRDPGNLSQALSGERLIKFDAYNNPYNTSSNHITWYGRFDPRTGSLERGQFLLPRLSSGKGNTVRPSALMADAQGQVFLVGVTTCCLPLRSELKIAGIPVGTYAGGEAFLLVVSTDFKQRLVWTPFTLNGHDSSAVALDVQAGRLALAANLSKGSFITHQALQPEPNTLPEAYLVLWSLKD